MKQVFRTAMAIAITTALGSTAALAQSTFTGFGLGVDVSMAQNSVDISSVTGSLNKNNSASTLKASYGFGLGKSWVGTVGLSFNMKNPDYDVYTSGFLVATAKINNHYALSFEPGYRVGSNGLLYGKLAMHVMDVNYTNNAGFDRTKTHPGAGLGIGFAYALNPSLEVNVGYEAVQFDSQPISTTETAKPKQSNLNLGLAYRF